MRKFNVFLTFLIAFVLSDFAALRYEESYAMESVYETDFSRDDDAFVYELIGKVNEIKKGVLHLKGISASGKTAMARLERQFGNNSITEFRIKFGKQIDVGIRFLWMEDDRIILVFNEDGINIVSYLDDKKVSESRNTIRLDSGRWYDVRVSIEHYTVTVWIDEEQICIIMVDSQLPSKGFLSFGTDQELWLDDLRIEQEPVVLKEERVAVLKEAVIYETDFSRDDGMFDVHRQLWEVRDGVLHLKGTDPGGNLKIPYGRDSRTSFRLKLSPEKPRANFSVLWDWNKGRAMGHTFIIRQNKIDQFTQVNGTQVFSHIDKHEIAPDIWHKIDISLRKKEYSLFVDGRLAATAPLHEDLPERGYLFIVALDTEFWIDDLKIVGGEIEKEELAIAKEPAEEREKPLSISADLRAEGLELYNVEFAHIFPVFFKYYDEYPIGKAVLRNNENVPMTGIEVKLFIKQYMDNPKICRAPSELKGGIEKAIDLNALFTNKVLEITEGTKVSANITIEYMAQGKLHTIEKLETVRIHNRNALTWEDTGRAAAFITAKDPLILKFSKNIAGMIQEKGSKTINANLRMAMALHEALTLYGMSYVVDPITPYKEFSIKRQEIDFLQFPKQSLDYKAGDCDDLSILYCALFESVGVETAFITIPGHIFMAFSVDMKPDEARKRFLRADELIFREEKTWIPVEITEIGGGFLKAWQAGAKEWRENVARGQADFHPIHEAWGRYEPVGLPGESVQLTLPDRNSIVSAYLQELIKFIDREIFPQVAELQAAIKKSKGNPKEINKLGILYARYGLLDRAKREFKNIIEKNKNFVPGLINLGNIYYLNNDMRNALTYYERAFELAPENPTVLLCVARTNHELENYGLVRDAYNNLKKVDPDLAYQFSYLSLRGEEAVRSAELSKVKDVVIWED